MKPLTQLPVEMKALLTATLVFLGLAILMALSYLDFSHIGSSGSPLLSVKDIAATYYGPGVGYVTLMSLAHIHMMALSVVFFMVGFIFVHSSFPVRWKISLSVLPYIAFLVDVSGWFLTKMNVGWVYLVLVGGGAFVMGLGAMILLSLYEMWLGPTTQRSAMVSGERETAS